MKQFEKIGKRVERKLPSLIADGGKLGLERDIVAYRLSKFKQANPDKFRLRKIRIEQEVIGLKQDIDIFWRNHKKR